MQNRVNVVFFDNPFNPHKEYRRYTCDAGVSIRDWLAKYQGKPVYEEFSRPTLCLVNGKGLMREEWDYVLKPDDKVAFTVIPGGITELIVVLIVAIVAAVIAIATMPDPEVPGTVKDADPVYQLSGQRNQTRLMSPIEVVYGRNRSYPSNAARSWAEYRDNEQFLYSLYCFGQGEFEIEGILVEDTPIENFEEAEFEIIPPGAEMTLFPDNVETSPEVANLQLYGPNEPEYDSWAGPFVCNEPGTLANRIDVDLSWPQGIYISSGGVFYNDGATVEFQYQAIDNGGSPIGGWLTLFDSVTVRRTNTPQRLTFRTNVAPGRYQVRGRRTDPVDDDTERMSDTYWETLRAFLPSTKVYGDVTLLAVKIRATNNINNNARQRINAWITRMLPTWDTSLGGGVGGWTAPIATRSIVWAFCDLFRSQYGARLPDAFLDMDGLLALNASYTIAGKVFDWTFDQRITIWEAAKSICRVGRAVPMLFGSRVGMVRDRAKTVVNASFGPDNIVRGSFRWDILLFESDAPTCVVMEYVDPVSWKQETVECVLPDGTPDNPENIKLAGCTDRTRAYQEGLYIAASRRYLREQITFRTGLEGHLPNYGDLVAVAHDVPRWGQFAIVEIIVGLVVYLADPVYFDGSGDPHYIAFRTKEGGTIGPFQVTAGADNYSVVLSGAIDTSSLYFDPQAEPVQMFFGLAEKWARKCQVASVTPTEGEEVEIVCTNYDERIYAYDAAIPDGLPTPQVPPAIPDRPEVTGLIVGRARGAAGMYKAIASWRPAAGALSYVVETSQDGTHWAGRRTTTETDMSFMIDFAQDFYVRVAAVNVGRGAWATWTGEIGYSTHKPAAVTGLVLSSAWTGSTLSFEWQPVVEAAQYRIRVYRTSAPGVIEREQDVSGLDFGYTNAMAIADGAVDRALTVKVAAVNSAGESTPLAVLVATNPVTGAATGLNSFFVSGSTYDCVWTFATPGDFDKYKVYRDTVSGFTPGPGNLVYTGTVAGCQITTGGVPTYWVVATLDKWGTEETLSAEALIP